MKKLGVLVFVTMATVVALAWGGGVIDTIRSPQALQAMIAQAGLWGPLLFLALSLAMFAAFMLAPVVWAATVVWPLPVAFSYSLGATLIASLLTYGAARQLGHGWAQERVPASIQRWEERMRTHPFSTIIGLRILLWANPLVDLFAAVSRVPTQTYLLATIVGLIPTTAFQILVGAGGFTIAGYLPWWGWGLVATAAIGAGVVFLRLRARRARHAWSAKKDGAKATSTS